MCAYYWYSIYGTREMGFTYTYDAYSLMKKIQRTNKLLSTYAPFGYC